MGSITNFLEMELLDHLCLTAYTPPANIYLCLCTADPTDAATGASMNETGDLAAYQRTAITFAAASSRSVAQTGDVTFPQATDDYASPITHWAIADSQTHGAGNVLAHGAFAASKTIYDNDTPKVASGEVTVSFSASELSDYAANGLLDFAFRNQSFTVSANYIALIITNPVTDGMTGSTITEPSGGSYARKQVNANGGAAPDWDLAVSGDPSYVDNNDAITFVTASANWGTIIAVALVDASSAGNLLMYDNDMTDKAVDSGDTAEFPAGDLDWQMS